MDNNQQSGGSHLFLVRLWWDEAGNISWGDRPAHGKVQHLISGKASHFSDWSSLIELFASMAAIPQSTSTLAPEVLIPDATDNTNAVKSDMIDRRQNSQ